MSLGKGVLVYQSVGLGDFGSMHLAISELGKATMYICENIVIKCTRKNTPNSLPNPR